MEFKIDYNQMNAVRTIKSYQEISCQLLEEKYIKNLSYKFCDVRKFSSVSDPHKINKIYWDEILNRAHWAGLSTIIRSFSWSKGVIDGINQGNLLIFCASLRSLIESCGDSMTTINTVPLTIAKDFTKIKDRISGKDGELCVNEELEDILIHYLFARKLTKSEKKNKEIPLSHKAKYSTEYIKILDNNEKDGEVYKLYSKLCQIVHPAADSVLYKMEQSSDEKFTSLRFGQNSDLKEIFNILLNDEEQIITACQYGYNSALILLKTLNLFNDLRFYTPNLNSIYFNSLNAWLKIKHEINIKSNKNNTYSNEF